MIFTRDFFNLVNFIILSKFIDFYHWSFPFIKTFAFSRKVKFLPENHIQYLSQDKPGMLSYRYWFLGKLRASFLLGENMKISYVKIWLGVLGAMFWQIKDSLVNKLFSYHPSGV